MGPTYIKCLLHIKKKRPGLPSNNSIALEIPKTNLIGCQHKAAPVVWNGLTDELKNTEKLNTFKQAYILVNMACGNPITDVLPFY